jgi:hypothetical protein
MISVPNLPPQLSGNSRKPDAVSRVPIKNQELSVI